MSKDYDPNDYNKGGLYAFIFAMVFTLGFFVYIALIHKGVDLKELKEAPAGDTLPATTPKDSHGA